MTFLLTVFLIGVLAAIAKIVLLMRLGQLRRLMSLHFVLDLAAGAIFCWLFAGTLTGMVIAAIAGLSFSLFLTAYRRFSGYERLAFRGWRPVWRPVGGRT